VLYLALVWATVGDAVTITLVIPGPVMLAFRLAGFMALAYLINWVMPEVRELIQAFGDSIIDDD